MDCELGAVLFDVNADIGGNAEYFFDHVHLSPQGSKRMAREYSELLEPIVTQIAERRGPTFEESH
jgi:lysophospholipase L1-like esterase